MHGETSGPAEASSSQECVYIYSYRAWQALFLQKEGVWQITWKQVPASEQGAANCERFRRVGVRVVFHPLQTPKGKENPRMLQLQCTTNAFSIILNMYFGQIFLQT